MVTTVVSGEQHAAPEVRLSCAYFDLESAVTAQNGECSFSRLVVVFVKRHGGQDTQHLASILTDTCKAFVAT